MAFSRSLQKAQIPSTCNLCETDRKIDWKCLDCELLMCTKCKQQVHSKFKFQKDHKIIHIKEVGSHKADIDFSQLNCTEHDGQICCMFCKSCDNMVCPVCITKVHEGHGLITIPEGYQIHIRRIKEGQKQAEISIDKLTNQEKEIIEITKRENDKYMEARNAIQVQNLDLKKAIDQATEKLIKDLDMQWKVFNQTMEKRIRQLIEMKTKLEEQRSNADKTINQNDAIKVFRECKDLEASIEEPIIQPDIKYKPIPGFLPGGITEFNLGRLQGENTGVSLNIIQEYSTNLSIVHFLTTNSDGSMWIGDGIDKQVQKVKTVAGNLKAISKYNTEIYGMALLPSSDLLMVTDSKLQQISGTTGQRIDSVYSVDSLVPTSIHVTRYGQVILGTVERFKLWDPTGRRALIIMDTKGVRQNTLEYDKNRQLMFTCVTDISTTSTGIIHVIDRLSEYGAARELVLSHDGDIINIYKGHPTINAGNPLKLDRIAISPTDNVILSDYCRNILHILDSSGHLITLYHTMDVGIDYPCSLHFTSPSQLYIGCGTNKEKKAKLYKVEISGC